MLFLFSRYLDQLGTNSEEKLDKHRFLIQSKVLEDEEFSRLMEIPTNLKTDEVS